MRLALAGFLLPVLTAAISDTECPDWIHQSGMANDLGLMAEAVSWGDASSVQGVCGNYRLIHEANGKYVTRMRIYENEEANSFIFTFRPTQVWTEEGGAIHVQRRLVDCSFMPDCKGRVHDRFQQAFVDLIKDVPDWSKFSAPGAKVYLTGHSLGGALQLFMGVYLHEIYGVVPSLELGLAGPFIGDQTFAENYQYSLRDATNHAWWQVESVSKGNSWQSDGTASGYNINDSGNAGVDPAQMFMEMDVVCKFTIEPLKIPEQSWGMHDLNQYRLGLKGTDCSL